MHRRCTIRDDRGRAFRIPEPGPAHPRGDRDDAQLALDEHRRLRLAFTMLRSPFRMAGATVIMTGLGIAMIATTRHDHVHDSGALMFAGGLLLVVGIGTPVVLLRGRRRYKTRLPQLPPMCAACACDMAGVYPERDGCAVCPRCAAAWRLTHPQDRGPPDA